MLLHSETLFRNLPLSLLRRDKFHNALHIVTSFSWNLSPGRVSWKVELSTAIEACVANKFQDGISAFNAPFETLASAIKTISFR